MVATPAPLHEASQGSDSAGAFRPLGTPGISDFTCFPHTVPRRRTILALFLLGQ